jgi:uncharacterized protein (TIGR03435 family)
VNEHTTGAKMTELRSPAKVCLALSLSLLLTNMPLMFAQSEAKPSLSFEVASVKPNTSGSRASRSGTLPGGGGFSATNITVRQLILTAYRLRSLQLVGGPGWIVSDRFDVDARAPENSTQEQAITMLEALLAERFGLVVHRETKEQPIYALVLGRPDRTLGPKMKPTTLDCSTPASTPKTTVPPTSPGGAAPACGMSTNVNNNNGIMTAGGRSISDLTAALANFVTDRIVVDRTGLMGMFDFELHWTPQTLQSVAQDPTVNTSDAPTIFAALQEQLGLKLESQRGAVEFLVVDTVKQPTPN